MIKVILKGFELASGLRVNFSKSCHIGTNVDSVVLETSTDFLHFRFNILPFKYHGRLLDTNPLLESSWEPLISFITRRLVS